MPRRRARLTCGTVGWSNTPFRKLGPRAQQKKTGLQALFQLHARPKIDKHFEGDPRLWLHRPSAEIPTIPETSGRVRASVVLAAAKDLARSLHLDGPKQEDGTASTSFRRKFPAFQTTTNQRGLNKNTPLFTQGFSLSKLGPPFFSWGLNPSCHLSRSSF